MAETPIHPIPGLKDGKAVEFPAGPAALILTALVILTGCGGGSRETSAPAALEPSRVVGIGRVEPEKRFLDLRAEIAGIVAELDVRPGDTLKRGDLILKLSSEVERAKIELAAARVATQQSQLRGAQAALSALRIRTENARLEFERARSLYEQKAETRASYDRIKSEYDALSEEIKQREADVKTAGSFIRQYRAEQKLAEKELARKTLLAPEDGIVLSLEISRGSYISPEQTIGLFAPEGPRIIRAEIDELFADLIRLDMKTHVRRQGETGILSEGRLTYLGPSFRKKSLFSDEVGDLEDRRVREVWISLESPDALLYGMRVECVIFLDKT